VKLTMLGVWLVLSASLFLGSCGPKAKADASAEAPPPAKVEEQPDLNIVSVDDPKQFPVATSTEIDAAPALNVTGSVTPDVARQVPVISLASGRVVEIDARLGDRVRKGQLLMRVQSADVSGAFSDYGKAAADERLARKQLDRSQELKDKGAIAQKDFEVAQDNEDDAKVTLQTAEEHLRVLGVDPSHPTGIVNIFAPVSGVITEQNVTAAGGVKTLDNSPNLFTISDLSVVWVLCDVYENNLSQVHLGELADIHLNAYPDVVLRGRVSDIGPVLDPNLRTAKVRLQVPNPGMLRVGMFATATFHGLKKQIHAVVPASAILHLHDRDWVYVPAGAKFRRVEVTGGKMLPGNMQEIVSGIEPGQNVVEKALSLQNTVEQ
jgi:cobalt-zinc-cadmium efflux system membrane fusion protein